jgi:hypothetical protein
MNMTTADPKQTAMNYSTTSNLLISRLSKGGYKKKNKSIKKTRRKRNTNTFQLTPNFKKYSNYKNFQSIRNLKKISSKSLRGWKTIKGGATNPPMSFISLNPNGGALQTTGNNLAISKNLAVAQSQYDNTAVLKK